MNGNTGRPACQPACYNAGRAACLLATIGPMRNFPLIAYMCLREFMQKISFSL